MSENVRYTCYPVTLKGMPAADDAVWDKAPAGELLEVESGRRPFLYTEFRILRDDSAGMLYVRFVAEDDCLHSTYRMDDEPLYTQDVFELFLSETGALSDYREIEVSPFDVIFTGNIHYIPQGERVLNMDWDIPGMKTLTRHDRAANRTEAVWQLPYAAFATAPRAGDAWRINVFRVDHSPRGIELQAWQATGARNFHVPERFGWLDFIA